MNYKIKKLLTNWRVVLLLIFLLFAIIAIHPNLTGEGLTIKSVARNSSAEIAGIQSSKPSAPPLSKERLIAMNNIQIQTISQYEGLIETLEPNQKLTVQTNRATYVLTVRPITKTIILNETEFVEVNETIQVNETINATTQLVNKTISKTIEQPKTETIILGKEDVGLRVAETPSTNIRKGLDLQGGTRVLLQPAEPVTKDTMDILLANMGQRLNVFGLSDVVLRSAGDLSGNQFIVVEIAGANEEDVQNLLARQGKFESKIGNTTVFRGGSDVTYVCRSADCSGLDPSVGCAPFSDGWSCRFRFAISLSPEAAQLQADTTSTLDVITVNEQGNPISRENQHLSKQIDLFLDDQLVDQLNIGSELKGRAVTEISITGSGFGTTENLAAVDALENMKRLQTILITGSLPVKLNVVKSDTLSPLLGPEFVSNALFVGLLAVLAVTIVLFIRYRKALIALPVLFTMIAELVLLLGFAALVGWNLDLAAIAGIIIVIGTSVDHQIIIIDETLKRDQEFQNWKTKLKNAFFIIIGAYLTTLFAMVPLLFAGAGLIKGFALTTIAGVSIGVLISRPAFAAIIEILSQN
ncbi:MAG: hypothetical protein QF632_05265 [Candidatus Woesearchaeota archaeon]|jgi:preprotein translocase subunit SecD|nr:hypothetical protein [Candidatus Woesearchaeota archaeon]MDP7458221.1 hypothetical protein [Candidatus Woesearchaeota archaeon]